MALRMNSCEIFRPGAFHVRMRREVEMQRLHRLAPPESRRST